MGYSYYHGLVETQNKLEFLHWRAGLHSILIHLLWIRVEWSVPASLLLTRLPLNLVLLHLHFLLCLSRDM